MKYKFQGSMHEAVLKKKYVHAGEKSFDEVIRRVAIEVNKYDPDSETMSKKTTKYITQKDFSPAGGIWRAAGSSKKNVSAVNCTTQNRPGDSIKSLGESWTNWAKIAAHGQGNGIDLSTLRPAESEVNNCSKTSTGAVSFMHVYDAVLSVISQDGRRGATKPDLWIYHPDALAFINAKNDITKLTTQNISIKVNSKFMNAVQNNEMIKQIWHRKDGVIRVGSGAHWVIEQEDDGPDLLIEKEVAAKDLWNAILTSAWKTGEPGVEFWDTSEKYSNSNYHQDKEYHVVSTNGCCFRGDQKILTKDGYKTFLEVSGQTIEVWNGFEWSRVTPCIMGKNQQMYEVVLSDGRSVVVSDNHKWILKDRADRVETSDLKIGDALPSFYYPVLGVGKGLEYADVAPSTKITQINKIGVEEFTYCATEPKRNSLCVNGVIIGNSEQKLDPFNTCILSSINLYNMPTMEDPAWATWLEERTQFGIRFLDNVVEMELKEGRSPHPEQVRKMVEMTRIGLGFTGLADWLIKSKIVYGSKESIDATEQIMKVFARTAYRTSISLGKERGSFTKFGDWYKESEFVKRLCELTGMELSEFTHMRHLCCISVAPVGTLSMVTGSGGSGVEPLFAPYYIRKERSTTGSWVEHPIFNDCVLNECDRLGVEPTMENVKGLIANPEWRFVENLNSLDKVGLMSVVGKYVDSGISVTYNLPKTASVRDVEDIYFKAWRAELKSVTVYRDGSREGVLVHTEENPKTAESPPSAEKHIKTNERPKVVECEVHYLTAQGQKWIVMVGIVNDQPYELFCGKQEIIKLSPKNKKGQITRQAHGRYMFCTEHIEEIDIKETFRNEAGEAALTRMISLALRRGLPLENIVSQLEKSQEDMLAFSRAIARVLKKYIPDGTPSTNAKNDECPNKTKEKCNIVRQGGCETCLVCGWSRCN